MLIRLTPYDTYERHRTVELLLNNTSCNLVLDVGGTGILWRFLRGTKIISLNIDHSGSVRYGGGIFPFAPKIFDAVITLDTLEHVPRENRGGFLEECIRMATTYVLVAAPYGSPGHSEYEERLNELFKQVNGDYNPWLLEHIINRLPTEEEISEYKSMLLNSGFSVKVFYAGNYEWQCQGFERALKFGGKSRLQKKVSNFYYLLHSLAIWHKISLSENPYNLANRFYIFGRRD